MYCESCGSFIPDGQSFCSNCGAQARVAAPVQQAPAQPVQPTPVQPVQPVPVQPMYQQPAQPTPVQPLYQQPVQPMYQQQVPVQPAYQQPVYAQQVQPVYQQVTPIKGSGKRSNGSAIAGLIFGILTLCFCWIPYFPFILGLMGLIFSIVGVCKKNGAGKGKAVAGLILSILGTAACALILTFFWMPVANEVGDVWDEAWESAMEEADLYNTSYSNNNNSNSNNNNTNDNYYITGDFVTTDNGYVSGVLLIDACTYEFG